MNWRSKLRFRDLIGTGLIGLRSRRGRTALTALGIAIGIASMVAVVGISASSKAALLAEIDSFGTNLLEVQASGTGINAEPLPVDAQSMISRADNVQAASAVIVTDFDVRRNVHDASLVGITAIAVDPELFDTLRIDMLAGRPLDHGLSELPVTVLGDTAATRLGITSPDGGPMVSIGGEDFVVVGILDKVPLNPDISRSALIGDQIAAELLEVKLNATTIYARVAPELVEETAAILKPTANPASPSRASVTRPSALLEARAQVNQGLQSLLLALGGVALIVGGVGIANVMVISVLERRGEIGLRRALGATKGHIRSQFVLEAALLSGLGGFGGIGLGALITVLYGRQQDWVVDIPPEALVGGVVAALVIGILAGLYPAAKAARLDPALAVSGGTG